MFGSIGLALGSCTIGMGLGLFVLNSAPLRSVDDQCYKKGYSVCVRKGDTIVPTTGDPRVRKSLDKLISGLSHAQKGGKR